jgi:hypothetical protein
LVGVVGVGHTRNNQGRGGPRVRAGSTGTGTGTVPYRVLDHLDELLWARRCATVRPLVRVLRVHVVLGVRRWLGLSVGMGTGGGEEAGKRRHVDRSTLTYISASDLSSMWTSSR